MTGQTHVDVPSEARSFDEVAALVKTPDGDGVNCGVLVEFPAIGLRAIGLQELDGGIGLQRGGVTKGVCCTCRPSTEHV